MRSRVSWRRLAAFAVDYLVVALYMGLLYLVGRSADFAWVQTPWQAQLFGFVTLTLPVVLYFTVTEGVFGATLGKRLLGLRVTAPLGSRLPLERSLLRSIVKFLPWELSHTAVHRLVFWTAAPEPLTAPQLAFVTTAYVSSLSLAALFVFSLFVGPHRPLYDRISGALVSNSPQRSIL